MNKQIGGVVATSLLLASHGANATDYVTGFEDPPFVAISLTEDGPVAGIDGWSIDSMLGGDPLFISFVAESWDSGLPGSAPSQAAALGGYYADFPDPFDVGEEFDLTHGVSIPLTSVQFDVDFMIAEPGVDPVDGFFYPGQDAYGFTLFDGTTELFRVSFEPPGGFGDLQIFWYDNLGVRHAALDYLTGFDKDIIYDGSYRLSLDINASGPDAVFTALLTGTNSLTFKGILPGAAGATVNKIGADFDLDEQGDSFLLFDDLAATARNSGVDGSVLPLVPILLRGTAAPDGPAGSTFFVISQALTNNSNEVLIEASLTGGASNTTNNVGVWSNGGNGAGSALGLVGLKGSAAVGGDFAGTNYNAFDALAMTNSGLVGFEATVSGAGVVATNDRGIFSELSGGLDSAAREGATAPGAGTAVFNIVNKPSFAENLAAFIGALKIDSGAGVSGSNDAGLWISDGTTTSLAVREGDLVGVAGISPGAVFGAFSPRVVASGSDTVAFSTSVLGNGTTNQALFSGTPGALSVVAAKNDVIDGVTLLSIAAESLSSTGDVAFRSFLSGQPTSSNIAIFSSVGGSSKLAAQEGDPVPGLPDVVFSDFREMHVVPGGDIFFRAYLSGIDVDSSNDGCLCRYEYSSGQVSVQVREGDLAFGTDESVINLIQDFDVNDAGGLVYNATLLINFGDSTSANNEGLWMSPKFGKLVRLVAREGDLFEFLPGDFRNVTNLSIDTVANAVGGTGGSRTVLSDSGAAIIKVSSNFGGAGVFFLGIPLPL